MVQVFARLKNSPVRVEIPSGREWSAGRLPGLVLTVLLTLLAGISLLQAAEIPKTDFVGPALDLRPSIKLVQSDDAMVAVTVPGSRAGQVVRMELRAHSGIAPHYWLLFSIANPRDVSGRFVLELDRPGISGSGLSTPLTHPVIILSASATEGAEWRLPWQNTLALSVPPRSIAGFAVEVDHPAVRTARLWKAEAFQAARTREMFLAGVLVGIASLIMLGLLALHILRPMPALPPAALLAAGATGFVAVNTGILEPALHWVSAPAALWRLAAFFEGLMLTGLVTWLFTWLELPRRSRLMNAAFWLFAFLSAALAAWGLLDPAHATFAIRTGFLLVVTGGYALVLAMWRRRRIGSESGLITWTLLFAWTILAALAVASVMDMPMTGIILSAVLVLTMLSLGVTMARAAFSPSAGLRSFLSGAARRALALVAARQVVWDFDLVARRLEVGSELERQLGMPAGSLAEGGARAFEGRIHPSDLPAYQAAIEAASHRGAGPFSIQFRLRRGDGSYRWYLLRGRPVRDNPDAGVPTRLIGVLMDVTAIRRSEERLLSDAVRDRVTGLPNRPLLLDRLSRAMQRAGSIRGSLYLLVIDVDRFRNINDAWGFETGDMLLNQMARRIGEMTEPEDTVARLPGDQFAVIVDATGRPRDITAFAERLRRMLARPFDLGVREVSLTVCMGITRISGDLEMEAEDVLKQAEIALFEARKRGADSISFFEDGMLGDRSRLVSLEQDLRRAVERGEIEVLYQPIMHLCNGTLAGFEALVRWRHPLHGLMGPDSFVPLAEEIGLIGDISRVVLEEATRNLGIWQRAFRPEVPLFVAVNISSVQLLNASLVDEVGALIEREGIDPSTLKLELTESLILENPELGRKILERLAALGVRIACDDFGTGYSSLATLRDLPFSTLKIDRSFVGAEENDVRAAVILENVVNLAHGLGMDVVAEGVETEEQMARLTALGCDMAQGWLIGQPVSARRVIEALTGMSLDVGRSRSRFAAFRERLFGSRGKAEEEDGQLVLPVPPMPSVPSMSSNETEANTEKTAEQETDTEFPEAVDPEISTVREVREEVSDAMEDSKELAAPDQGTEEIASSSEEGGGSQVDGTEKEGDEEEGLDEAAASSAVAEDERLKVPSTASSAQLQDGEPVKEAPPAPVIMGNAHGNRLSGTEKRSGTNGR